MSGTAGVDTDYDVIIAGAGPAGSALAIELADDGMRVLLADRERFPRDKPCGDFVSPKGLHRLSTLGCGREIRRLGAQPIRESHLYLGREPLVSGSIPRIAGLPAYGHALPRRELDELMFRHAVEVGATPQEACLVEGFESDASGVTVRAVREGRACHYRARLLVGADGANSAVARAAGLGMKDPRYLLASLRAYVQGLSMDGTLMYFDEDYFPGYAWIFPVRKGLCNIGVGMVKEPMVRDGLGLRAFYDRFCERVRRLAASRGATIEIGPHQGWPIPSYGGARRNYFPGGLLIGDAACFVDPINGEGIPLALDSAGIAAATIRRCFASGDFGERALSGYERAWRARFDADLGISDLVVSLIRNRVLLPAWLTLFRTMSLTARDDPRYAAVTGGILAGVVPAREGITPEMFVRAVVHRPDFWREVLRLEDTLTAHTLARRGGSWLRWQRDIWNSFTGRDPWARAWLREVLAKQARLLPGSRRPEALGAWLGARKG